MRNSLYSDSSGALRSVPNIPEKFNLRNRNEQSFLSILVVMENAENLHFAQLRLFENYFSCLVGSCQAQFQLKMRK